MVYTERAPRRQQFHVVPFMQQEASAVCTPHRWIFKNRAIKSLLSSFLSLVFSSSSSSVLPLSLSLSPSLSRLPLLFSSCCSWTLYSQPSEGSRIAQWVQCPTEKPNAILMRVRVPAAARDFSPRVDFQCRLSYGVRTAPVCSHMHQHLCARQKFQCLATMPLFGHPKILQALIGVGSAALAAAVPCPGKATRISRKGQRRCTRKLNTVLDLLIIFLVGLGINSVFFRHLPQCLYYRCYSDHNVGVFFCSSSSMSVLSLLLWS